MKTLLFFLGVLVGIQSISVRAATNDVKFASLDLSAAYNSSLTASMLYHKDDSENHLRDLPSGSQTFASVPFTIGGTIQLDGGQLHMLGKNFPKRIQPITVNALAKKIHLFHGTGWKDGNGRVLEKMTVTYTDGSAQEFSIQYGVHVRDWWEFKEEAIKDENSTVAWRGSNPQAGEAKAGLRLYKTTFTNPKPDTAIQSIGFVSGGSMSCPFILGITLEK